MKTNQLLKTVLAVIFLICSLSILARPKAIANIIMKDGTSFNRVELELPKGWEKKIKFKDDSRKEVKLQSNDVDYIVFWHKDSPQRQAIIKYMFTAKYDRKTNEIDTVPRENERWWLTLDTAGEHLSYWLCFTQIQPSKGGISFSVRDYPNHLVKPEMPDRAFMVPINGLKPSVTRDWLKGFLSDDPVMADSIANKGYYKVKDSRRIGNFYNPFSYDLIVLDYNPKR